jgi:hypothetical protein
MVKKVTVTTQPREAAEVGRARLTRLAAFLAEEAGRQPAVLHETADDLEWAARCLKEFLAGRAASLEHAFGLIRRPGNPGKTRIWGSRARDADAAGLSTIETASRLVLLSQKATG